MRLMLLALFYHLSYIHFIMSVMLNLRYKNFFPFKQFFLTYDLKFPYSFFCLTFCIKNRHFKLFGKLFKKKILISFNHSLIHFCLFRKLTLQAKYVVNKVCFASVFWNVLLNHPKKFLKFSKKTPDSYYSYHCAWNIKRKNVLLHLDF